MWLARAWTSNRPVNCLTKARGLRAPAPTGLRPPAQGWRAAPTLGNGNPFINPNGVASLVDAWPAHGHNPFRVDVIMPAISQGRRRANPGLEDAAPLGLTCAGVPVAARCPVLFTCSETRLKNCPNSSAVTGHRCAQATWRRGVYRKVSLPSTFGRWTRPRGATRM